jgi:hypothetical protein
LSLFINVVLQITVNYVKSVFLVLLYSGKPVHAVTSIKFHVILVLSKNISYTFIDQLFFINATDKFDKDIVELRQRLLDAAFEHPNWGQHMSTKFVPLELQLAKQSSEGKKVL